MYNRAFLGVALAATWAIACGSSSDQSATARDGGPPSAEAGGLEAGAPDGATTGPDGGDESAEVSAFCAALASYDAQCGAGTRCAQAEVQYCSTWAPSFSTAFLTAETSCVATPATCPDGGGNPVLASCVRSTFGTPTAAQMKVKADFCAMCPDGASAFAPTGCSDFLTLKESDAGNLTAVGAIALLLNDSLDDVIDQQCTGPAAAGVDAGTSDCAVAFELCAAAILVYDANLPAACTDGSLSLRAKRAAIGL
jgi:hypothetical protein